MTNKELQEILKKYPDNATVLMSYVRFPGSLATVDYQDDRNYYFVEAKGTPIVWIGAGDVEDGE